MPTFREDLHTGHEVPLVETDDILKGAVTTDKIADGAVDTDQLAAKAVTTEKIADKAVDNGKLDDWCVDNRTLGDKAVDNRVLDSVSVDNRVLDDEAVDNRVLANEAVTTEKLSGHIDAETGMTVNAAVTESKIQDGAVTTDKISGGNNPAVTREKIADGAVNADKLSSVNDPEGAAVTAGKIAAGAVHHENLELYSVTGDNIAEKAIDGSNIKDKTIAGINIKDGTIGTDQLSGGLYDGVMTPPCITTEKIADWQPDSEYETGVTTEKIADGAVTNEKLAPGSITSDKLADDVIEELQTIMDAEPTAGSVLPVQSGGVFDAILQVGPYSTAERMVVSGGITDGKKLAGNGYFVADANYEIRRYQVYAGEILKLHLSKDGDRVYQFQTTAGEIVSDYGVLHYITGYSNEAADGYVIVPEGTFWLFVSQLKTNATNKVFSATKDVDEQPTQNSQHFVKSGGVYAAIDSAVSDAVKVNSQQSFTDAQKAQGLLNLGIQIENTPTLNSNKIVTSDGIAKAISSSLFYNTFPISVYRTDNNKRILSTGWWDETSAATGYKVVLYYVENFVGEMLFLDLEDEADRVYQFQSVNVAITTAYQANTYIKGYGTTAPGIYVKIPAGTKYLCVCSLSDNVTNVVKRATKDIDATPTQNSHNFVESGGVYSAIAAATAKGTGVLDLNSPREFVPKLRDLKRSVTGGTNNQSLVLAHFSDIHGSKTNVQRIVEWCSDSNISPFIDDILLSGDIVYDQFTDGIACITEVDGAENILMCMGNHDGRVGSNWTAKTVAEKYNAYIKDFKDNWSITISGEVTWYYKDYVAYGIRLIVCDCMDSSAAQGTWLENTLADARTNNLAVVVMTHSTTANPTEIPCSFTSPWKKNDISSYGGPDIKDKVAAFITAGGEFICYLAGHLHWDKISTINQNQLCIQVDAARTQDNAMDKCRVVGEKSQDLFNVVSINTVDKTIRLLRVGATHDRFSREAVEMCYRYKEYTDGNNATYPVGIVSEV